MGSSLITLRTELPCSRLVCRFSLSKREYSTDREALLSLGSKKFAREKNPREVRLGSSLPGKLS